MLILLKLYLFLFEESAPDGVTEATDHVCSSENASLHPPSYGSQGSNSSGQARTADVLT